jgi:hypothetical protein
MPIITYAELNTLLALNNTKATECALLIPIIQDKIIEYCNNNFVDTGLQVQSSKLSLSYVELDERSYVDSTDETIDFTKLFIAGNDISIIGSLSNNNGVYEIESVTANQIVLVAGVVLTNELNAEFTTTFTITRVRFQIGIKADTAWLINRFLTTQGSIVKSESLPGGYSVTFKDEAEQMKAFNKYRKPYR